MMFRFDRHLLEHFDFTLLLIILLVCGMALFNLYSASSPATAYGTPAYVKQSYYFILGCCICLFLLSFDYQALTTLNYPIYVGVFCC